MPDIALRFNRDMLVLSGPLTAALDRQGIDVERDLEYLCLVEPEALREALRLESIAGAQCLLTSTEGITSARLAHKCLEDSDKDIAQAALRVVRSLKPQHTFVEIGPCGLPLDGSSAASLNENRQQYARAGRAFLPGEFDAFLLSDFSSMSDLKCALMGIAQISDRPVFSTVKVTREGLLRDGRTRLEEAVTLMQEFGAAVVGFSTSADERCAQSLSRRVRLASSAPLLVQLCVGISDPKQGKPTEQNPYYCADSMVSAASLLRESGVQFLRAGGNATPAYTGALVAATAGFDVLCTNEGMFA